MHKHKKSLLKYHNEITKPRQVTNEIIITIFSDNTMAIKSPKDFMLFRDIMNLAERTVIDQQKQDKAKDKKIAEPTVNETIQFGRP